MAGDNERVCMRYGHWSDAWHMRRVFARSGVLALSAMLTVAGLFLGGALPVAAGSYRYVDPIFSSVTRTVDLVYGHAKLSNGTVQALKLDLYRPAGDSANSRAVVIFVHGGDSTIDKGLKRNRDVAIGFARRGFVSAAINYRRGTSGSTTDAEHDTRAAVRWFRANAARYRIDPNRIVIMGSSAGAINVLNVNFAPEDAGDSGHAGYSSAVAAAIAVSGTDTEPQNIGRNEPPIAMFHAADDETIPIETAMATCQDTQAMGNVCEFFRYETGGHPPGFLIKNRVEITEQASAFICRNVMPGVCRGIK
jgi:acetyl esterase/lipase